MSFQGLQHWDLSHQLSSTAHHHNQQPQLPFPACLQHHNHLLLHQGCLLLCQTSASSHQWILHHPLHPCQLPLLLHLEAHCRQKTSPAPFPTPTCYLSHIPLPPITREDSQAIPASLNILSESKVLLHSSFYHYLTTSINLPPLTKEHIHTIYTHPTYSMMLPTALTQSYWYLLPFAHKPLSHKYPAKDYATLAMHFLAQSVDDAALKQIMTFYNKLQHPLLTPYVYPTPTSTSHLTPQKVHVSYNI
ncbi:hypothetical protein DB41_AX00010 [Neochlamydia sp. TUME1]|nr:hypothetical protein DB41_AX00010 [Neochlamydia sp. TUME1]